MKNVNNIFRYPGGKSKRAAMQEILAKMPKEFSEYREPFSGGSSIALSIDPNVPRWINDLDERPMTVLQALRDDPGGFIAACRAIPPMAPDEKKGTSGYESGKQRLREVFDAAIAGELENKAVAYYFINRTAHSARTASEVQYFSAPERWNIVATDRLHEVAKRLQGMTITIGDYSSLLQAPGKNPWIYLDPPYVSDSLRRQSSRLYAKSFEIDDHVRLADAFKRCPHRICLSYDDHPMIRDLYRDFWIYEAQWVYSVTSLAKDPDRIRPTANELIIANYPPEDMAGVDAMAEDAIKRVA